MTCRQARRLEGRDHRSARAGKARGSASNNTGVKGKERVPSARTARMTVSSDVNQKIDRKERVTDEDPGL